jgi:hypothetical protein
MISSGVMEMKRARGNKNKMEMVHSISFLANGLDVTPSDAIVI